MNLPDIWTGARGPRSPGGETFAKRPRFVMIASVRSKKASITFSRRS
jgi:hypothetical protein